MKGGTSHARARTILALFAHPASPRSPFSPYSFRSTSAGSNRAARRAGT
jgi:hypothetical protein